MAYGLRIGIRVNNPEALEQVYGLLPPGSEPASLKTVDRMYSLRVGGHGKRSKVRHYHLLWADARRLCRTMHLVEALRVLESDLSLYVAEWSEQKLFVHAGVVARDGRAIVIPGRSFSGKSTLVAALVRAGATYYSDEYALFDTNGRVHSYPKPLFLREDAPSLLREHTADIPPELPRLDSLPVGLAVVSQYQARAQWHPRMLSPGQAVLALLANTIPARRQPGFAFDILRQVVSKAPVLSGVRGEAEEATEALLDFGQLSGVSGHTEG